MLCAFLRLPYDPDPGDTIPEGQDPAEHARARAGFRAIRHTVVRIIGNHLRAEAPISWQGHDLDFTDVVFTGATVSFRGARFVAGRVAFTGARFEGGTVTFPEATGAEACGTGGRYGRSSVVNVLGLKGSVHHLQ